MLIDDCPGLGRMEKSKNSASLKSSSVDWKSLPGDFCPLEPDPNFPDGLNPWSCESSSPRSVSNFTCVPPNVCSKLNNCPGLIDVDRLGGFDFEE